jgi:ribosomal protein S18 acetylase RimI-like enzyme
MIRKITEDEVDIIDSIMTKFGQKTDIGVPPNFVEQLKTSVKDGKAFVYGSFTDNNNLNGVGVFGNVSKRFSLIYAENNSKIEVELIDTIFNNHSSASPYMGAAGQWVTDSISKRFVELDFRKIDRAYMTVAREPIEALKTPTLPEDFELELYEDSQIDELAQLMFKGNNNHIDQIVFPNFFGSVEACKDLIGNIVNNVYGEYREPYSWLLKENGKLVGACLMTIRKNGEAGYIPDIVIDPDYQGRGLGKAILIHSMKEILEGESDILRVDLDVTLENKALFLYESIGYEQVREYSIYVWLNESKS